MNDICIRRDDLARLIAGILAAKGVSEADAAMVARVLPRAKIRDVDGNAVVRLAELSEVHRSASRHAWAEGSAGLQLEDRTTTRFPLSSVQRQDHQTNENVFAFLEKHLSSTASSVSCCLDFEALGGEGGQGYRLRLLPLLGFDRVAKQRCHQDGCGIKTKFGNQHDGVPICDLSAT
jgi:hypothetical protein